ncbi:MAG: ZIP family metal transporter [Clostridia bacterium]|nr:ZIP family metal transporter [Clostridia bacterium]
MDHMTTVLIGVGIPLLGTTLGAAMVFFLKNEMREGVRKALLGFASGVMIAASVWSLLIPAIDMDEAAGGRGWPAALIGFLLGIGFLLLLDTVIPHLHMDSDKPEGRPSKLGKSLMLVLAVTLHNLPEGMAVGVVLAGALSGSTVITTAGALALSVGIAIQNVPEGAIISMPLIGNGLSRRRAFGYGFASGVVEPVGALLTIGLTALVRPVLPYILAFAAGAMLYVVVEELIPEAQAGEHSNIGTIGAALGFALMMVLDVALG